MRPVRTRARALASPPLAVRVARAGSLEEGAVALAGEIEARRVRWRRALVGSLGAPQPEAVRDVPFCGMRSVRR